MNLPFSETFRDGTPTFFIDKIWDGFIIEGRWTVELRKDYRISYREKFNHHWDSIDRIHPKVTTIRKDVHNRWKPGMKIHFVINNRSKKRFQFAPVLECISVQKIEIEYLRDLEILRSWPLLPPPVSIEIDGRSLVTNEFEILAKNDGFDSLEDFFSWFNTDFTGKIIHWTTLKY